jgi:hypothetical protein
MGFYQAFEDEVKRGLEGKQSWIPVIHKKLNDNIVYGKNMYWLFGGMPGSGKTSIVDSTFVLEPYIWWKNNRHKTNINPFWIYRSMERKVSHKIAKWTAYLMFVDHGIIIDVPTLLSWPNKKRELSNKEKELIEEYRIFFDEMLERVIIFDGSTNPTGIYNDIVRFMESKGTYRQVDDYNRVYVPNNDNDIVFHVTDHVGLISAETGATSDKQILDKHSSYMVRARDRYGITPIDICQLNRNIEDTYRLNTTDVDVKPSDFAGSSDMYQNCDVAIGLMNPYKLKVFEYGGYDIPRFISKNGENRYRSLKIIKNSFGIDDIVVSFLFYGENGAMVQLPKSEKLSYDKLINGNYTEEFFEWRHKYPQKLN